jgi:bifunctional ADP-heptose synthase (sugar kinase/adenylyltransferase)
MLDRYWHGSVDRISPEAPVPVVRVYARSRDALVVLPMWPSTSPPSERIASFVGVVGDDEPGRKLETLMQQTGIQTHFWPATPGCKTTVKLRVIGRQQQLLRLDFENEPDPGRGAGLPDLDALPAPACQCTRRSCFRTTAKGGLAHMSGSMIAAARSAGKPVLVDPKGSRLLTLPPGATVITPNRANCSRSSAPGCDEADLADRRRPRPARRPSSLTALLLTRSEEGMTLFDAARVSCMSAHRRAKCSM